MIRIMILLILLGGWGQGAWAATLGKSDPFTPPPASTPAPDPSSATPSGTSDPREFGKISVPNVGTINAFDPGEKRLAETCQTYESMFVVQGDITANNPAASLIQNFLRAFAALQQAFNTKIADAAVGLGLILLVLFSLFYGLRLVFPFTPYGQIAETYNQIFNLWGVAAVVFLIVMNPNFIPNNVVYPVFKSLVNANFTLLQVSSTLANEATEGASKTDPSCLGKSGGNNPLERIIRGIVEQTTYAQGVSMNNLCISLSIIGFADPDDGDRCLEANRKKGIIEACKAENVAKGLLEAAWCEAVIEGQFLAGAFMGALNLIEGLFTMAWKALSAENPFMVLLNVVIKMIFGFGLFMIALYKYLMIGLYMLEAAMLPFILSAFWSLILIVGIIPAGREVIKTAFFAVLQGGATIIFLGVGLSVIAAMDTYVWYQFTKDPNMVQTTLVSSKNFMYAWPLWMILITSFAGINALKQARSMAESVFKTGLSLQIADSLFGTFKQMVYFAMDVLGDLASAGGFSKIRRVVLR